MFDTTPYSEALHGGPGQAQQDADYAAIRANQEIKASTSNAVKNARAKIAARALAKEEAAKAATIALTPRPDSGDRSGQQRRWMTPTAKDSPASKTFRLVTDIRMVTFRPDGNVVTITSESMSCIPLEMTRDGQTTLTLEAGRREYARLLKLGYTAL